MREYEMVTFHCDKCRLQLSSYSNAISLYCVCGGIFKRASSIHPNIVPKGYKGDDGFLRTKLDHESHLQATKKMAMPAPVATKEAPKTREAEWSEEYIAREFNRGMEMIEQRLRAEIEMDRYDA